MEVGGWRQGTVRDDVSVSQTKLPATKAGKQMLLRVEKNTDGPRLMPAWLFAAREEE